MNLLSVNGLTRMGREAPLFTGVSFGLDEGDKAALIGKNGSGKSTLLRCVAGELQGDSGTIIANQAAGISYLPQNPAFDPSDRIIDHIFKSRSPKLDTIREYESVCEELAREGSQPEGTGTKTADRLTKRLEELTHEMDEKDLWNLEAQIRSVLTTLGIDNLELVMGTLSGGMVKKVALAQVLVEDTRLILLDEPTNHLDIRTIAWLEEFLAATDRSVLMVTHDRYFLDSVCNRIYELDNRRLTMYEGNFSRYLEKKELEREIAANAEERIESVLRTEREWLLRGPKARGTKARARVDNIHRMINREKLATDKEFAFEITGRRLGGKILEVTGISKSWPQPAPAGSKPAGAQSKPEGGEPINPAAAKPSGARQNHIISDFSYSFKRGERIGVFGNNGSGKTTLLNLLTGKLEPDSGTVVRGDNTLFAYYEQNPSFPNVDMTVLAYVREAAEVVAMANGKTVSAGQLLERFGFEGKIQHSPVGTLSGGERKRLYLVRLLVSNPNFLVLDEPTNDFDIYTMGVLEQFLEGFAGCLLVVSHDRFFMDRVADTLFVLTGDGSVDGFVGSCTELLELQREEAKAEAATKGERGRKGDGAGSGRQNAVSPAGSQAPESAGQKAERNRPKKRTFAEEKEYAGIEAEIEKLENRKAELEGLLSGGETDHLKLAAWGREFDAAAAELEEKIARWEYLASFG